MKKPLSKYFFIPCLFVIIGLLACTPGLMAYFAGNMSDCAFADSCGETDSGTSRSGSLTNGQTMGRLVVDGGSHFLKSIADIHSLLSRLEASEVSEINFKSLQEAVNSAIESMSKAQASYLELKHMAAFTPYNETVINRLIEFDYSNFSNRARFIPSIFDIVKSYLSTGNVRGIYNQFHANSSDILQRLQSVKNDVDAGSFPKLSNVWRLNQKCSEYKLFGQYVARVFFKSNEMTKRHQSERNKEIREEER